MATGIQNTLEVLDLAKATATVVAAAKRDGAINVWDAPLLLQLIGPLNTAVKGGEALPAELSDLDTAEATAIAQKGLEVAYAWLAVFGIPVPTTKVAVKAS